MKATETKSIRPLSGSVVNWYGSADPDPYENVSAPEHSKKHWRPESVVDDDLPPHVKTLGHLWRVELLVAPAQVQLTGRLHHFSYEG